MREELEDAGSLQEFPDELRSDPIAAPALEAVYAARGHHMTWAEAWEAFEGHSGLSLSTRDSYGSVVRQLDKAKLPGPHDATRERVREYLRERAKNATRSTVRVDMAAATAILMHLFPENEERARLFKGHSVRFIKKTTKRDPLTRDDVRAMIATGKLAYPTALLMRLSLGTGGRRQEVYSGAYDLERKVLTVSRERAKTEAGARTIPLSDHVLPAAKRWAELRKAKALPPIQSVANNFATVRDEAKLPATKTLHSCRHAFATELARTGVAKDRREALTGHGSRDVHSGYVHLTADDLREDVAKVDFETGIEWPSGNSKATT